MEKWQVNLLMQKYKLNMTNIKNIMFYFGISKKISTFETSNIIWNTFTLYSKKNICEECLRIRCHKLFLKSYSEEHNLIVKHNKLTNKNTQLVTTYLCFCSYKLMLYIIGGLTDEKIFNYGAYWFDGLCNCCLLCC